MRTDREHRDRADALRALGAATLGESGGRAMRRGVQARVARAHRSSLPAYPVECTPGDNLAVHVAVATAPAGPRSWSTSAT